MIPQPWKFLPFCIALATAAVLGCSQDDGPTEANNNPPDKIGDARTIRGTVAGQALRRDGGAPVYQVIVQSTGTLETYATRTDAEGGFEVEIPEDETGSTFTVTFITPDGQPGGPLLFGDDGGLGYTGVEVDGEVDLGAIDFPADPARDPILPGDDLDLGESSVSTDVVTRLNDDGVPVGVPDFGRGAEAQGGASGDPEQQGDSDRDGLIDVVDADDDGDGIVDDFDSGAGLNRWRGDDVMLNFFMNLKIDDVTATAFFSGDVPGIENILRTRTVITFEVRSEPGSGRTITGARILGPPDPAPAYLSATTLAGGGLPTLWSTLGYELPPDGPDHFQQWVVPNDFMYTGDVFTAEITFSDGSTGLYNRMINYVFKSIPKLINVGAPGALAAFAGPAEIVFDGSQDLVMEWAPPVDDYGVLLVGLPYRFEVFYYDSLGGQIDSIDASTWPTPIPEWNASGRVYEVPGADLTTLSAGNTFTVQLPKEIFADTVQTATGPVGVARYKVDIAAQNNGNNAALMVRLRK